MERNYVAVTLCFSILLSPLILRVIPRDANEASSRRGLVTSTHVNALVQHQHHVSHDVMTVRTSSLQ